MSDDELPVAVIGAGPVGLAAAAHLAHRGATPLVLEAGPTVGTSVLGWGHVRVFSPWRYNTDPVAREMLERQGWIAPEDDVYPTGRELVDLYLDPLSRLPEIAPHLRLSHRVRSIARAGLDRMTTAGRDAAPFALTVTSAGRDEELLARAVIDVSGTYATPNPLGAGGTPARGEAAAADQIHYGIPDVLGRQRHRYAGRRVLVVGSGHSAFNVLIELAQLAEGEPGMSVTWAVRRPFAGTKYGGAENDALPERGKLGARMRALVDRGAVTQTVLRISQLRQDRAGVFVGDSSREIGPFDEIVSATGFRPDLAPLRELRLRLDDVLEAPSALAPLVDPNIHSCGTVPPHGARELAHPEAGFYIAGMKSYGRAPTFLMLTGYEQVRSIASALVGDVRGAESVELVLPHTGVCSGGGNADCCGQDGADDCGSPASECCGTAATVIPLSALEATAPR